MTIKDPTRDRIHPPAKAAHDGPPQQAGAADGHLRPQVTKRSVVIGGHKTSVSLEDAFWFELRSIAFGLGVHLSQLVASIDSERQHGNLSSAIRLFVFEYCRGTESVRRQNEQVQAVLAGAKRETAAH